jgi:hypothetical protein
MIIYLGQEHKNCLDLSFLSWEDNSVLDVILGICFSESNISKQREETSQVTI